jgi:histidyl-tRNA synthetase
VGSKSLLNEVELVQLYHEAFTSLGLKNYQLKINSRKILLALAETCGSAESMMDITIAIDKLDKIGIGKVKEELAAKGLKNEQVEVIEKYLSIEGSPDEKLSALQQLMGGNENAAEGIREIRYILDHLPVSGKNSDLSPEIDFTLARGLNYYTGIILEAKAPPNVNIGSIGGGGRYDDLTGLFGVPGVPGVGISFGVDRIYDVMEELSLFPQTVQEGTKVLFFNLGEAEGKKALELLRALREKKISSEIYHETAKLDKQFKYAEKKNIPYVIILGSRELEENSCSVKDLRSGEQKTVTLENLPHFLFI